MTSRAAIVRTVPARVGLVGNPSDGYGGAVLATTVPGLSATVWARRSDAVMFRSDDVTEEWGSLAEWRSGVGQIGHGDDQRIISAALWTLVEHLERRGRTLECGVSLRWSSEIPRSVGLAGSSALAIAVIDATAAVWGLELDRRVVAALALAAERDVLGIAAGWQDRIVQAFGCTVLVDTARMDVVDGVSVPTVVLPSGRSDLELSWLVAWSPPLASSSGDYHGPLRAAAATLQPAMDQLGHVARTACAAWEAGDLAGLATALDSGWIMRQSSAPLHRDHAALVELVRSCGLPATTPGSGGAVVALCVDPAAVARSIDRLERAGCPVIRFVTL